MVEKFKEKFHLRYNSWNIWNNLYFLKNISFSEKCLRQNLCFVVNYRIDFKIIHPFMHYSFYFSLIISVIIFHTFGQIYNYYPIYNPYLTTNSIIFSAPIEWLHAKQIGRKLLISWVPPFFSLKTCPTSKLVFEINTFLQQRQR